ncbi:Poly [ADP-ribose] polymerase 2 [Platanthera zijinensis]|uniref:NAD(+) ADP-ribosyltransferase n=1 Tax=Platanthera zijinensis TaxID=2320716 RepID=A0AAP0B2R0_9ASPA
MSSKLKVEEIRSQLTLRGLDSRGTKAMLVKRLESAMQIEEEKEKKSDPVEAGPADGGLNSHGKRKRGSVDPDDDQKEEDLDGEKLKKCTVRELKALAGRRGVSVSGTKGELVKRLCGVENPKDTVQEEEPVVIEEEKLVTATKKGGAVLDQWLPDDIKTRYHVLQKGVDSYDATLNQTNVGDNNNKFYVIQALESDNGGSFMVYCRWGRVGVKGQSKLHGPFSSQESAIHEFHTRFYEKTKNLWLDRKKFVSHPKCYTWLEMDYSEAGTEQMPPKAIKSIETQLQETKLEGRVAKFVSLVCNIAMMKQQMLEIGYNAEKLPLGKLSQSTILKGYDVLRRISDMVQQGDRKKLEQLSGEFYTVIPHDFGFKKMRDFVIDTPFKVKSKIEMVI